MKKQQKQTTQRSDLETALLNLKLSYMSIHVNDFIAETTSRKFSCHQILEKICRLENSDQEQRRTERRIKDAKIGRFKALSDFDWTWPRKIDRESIHRASQLEFMKEKSNLILVGPQGAGKTMIARNIAHTAAISGYSVIYTTASALVVDLGSQDGAR